MSLFEKIKNIRRSNLQEKKIKFPGGTGDIGFNAPKRREKVQKRLSRADDVYGTPDPFDPDYDKKVKKVDKRTKIGKKVSSAFETPKKSDLKKLDKQPGGYRAPAGTFGPGITQGQANVKDMQRRAYVKTPAVEYDPKTAPTGIKIPGKTYKTFRNASKGTRNISSMNPSEMQRAFGTSSTEGGAGASGSSKTVAKDYTKKINQANKNRKEFTGNKKTFQAFKKQADAASNKLVGEREKLRSFTGKKDVDAIKKVNKKIQSTERISKAYDLASKGKGLPNAPVVASDLKQVTDNTPTVTKNITKAPKGKTLPPTPSGKSSIVKTGTGVTPPPVKKVSTGITKSGNISYATDPTKLGGMKVDKATQAIIKRETNKTLKLPQNVKYAVAASKRKGIARGFTRFLGKLGPKGRLAAAGATAFFATPMGRNFAKNLAIGGGLTAALGLAGKKEKVLKKGDGLKPIGKVNVRYGLTGTSKKGQGGKIYDPKQMAQVGKVQKSFIDKYNKKASRNPFQKQIQYKAKGDGTYKVLDPKKK